MIEFIVLSDNENVKAVGRCADEGRLADEFELEIPEGLPIGIKGAPAPTIPGLVHELGGSVEREEINTVAAPGNGGWGNGFGDIHPEFDVPIFSA